MLLPNKYIGFNKSFVCVSACVFDVLGKKTMCIDKIWKQLSKRYKTISFDIFVRTLVFMKICKFIDINSEGEIFNENLKNNI